MHQGSDNMVQLNHADNIVRHNAFRQALSVAATPSLIQRALEDQNPRIRVDAIRSGLLTPVQRELAGLGVVDGVERVRELDGAGASQHVEHVGGHGVDAGVC